MATCIPHILQAVVVLHTCAMRLPRAGSILKQHHDESIAWPAIPQIIVSFGSRFDDTISSIVFALLKRGSGPNIRSFGRTLGVCHLPCSVEENWAIVYRQGARHHNTELRCMARWSVHLIYNFYMWHMREYSRIWRFGVSIESTNNITSLGLVGLRVLLYEIC